MDYIPPLQKKRRLEGDLEHWTHACQAKRMCAGVGGGCAPVEYGAVTDCPMDTWGDTMDMQQNGVSNGVNTHPVSKMVTDCPMDTWDTDMQQKGFQNGNGVDTHPVPKMMYAVQDSHPQQCCPRCMAGEPGHINHIMGY